MAAPQFSRLVFNVPPWSSPSSPDTLPHLSRQFTGAIAHQFRIFRYPAKVFWICLTSPGWNFESSQDICLNLRIKIPQIYTFALPSDAKIDVGSRARANDKVSLQTTGTEAVDLIILNSGNADLVSPEYPHSCQDTPSIFLLCIAPVTGTYKNFTASFFHAIKLAV